MARTIRNLCAHKPRQPQAPELCACGRHPYDGKRVCYRCEKAKSAQADKILLDMTAETGTR